MIEDKNEKNIDAKEFIPGAMGERIACLRKRKKLTQAQLAEQLGITAQAVSKWESGLSCPDIMTLVPLAQVLGVSTDELLGVIVPQDGQRAVCQDMQGQGVSGWDMQRQGASGRDAQGQGVPRQDPQGQGIYGRDVLGQGEPGPDVQGQGTFDRDVLGQPGPGRDPEDPFVEPTEASASAEGKVEEPSDVESRLIVLEDRDTQPPVSRLVVGAGACIVAIRAGDRFSLETEGYQDGEVASEVSDGTWEIRDVAKSLIFVGKNAFMKRKMKITIPTGYFFDFVKLNIGAGVLSGSGIHASESAMSVGAGQMTLKDFHSDGSTIKCGMGEINIQGALYGKCSVDCGMGAVKAALKRPAHYGYQTSIGMGDVKIGDNRQSGIGGNQKVNPGDENFYKISCSMGSVVFAFHD